MIIGYTCGIWKEDIVIEIIDIIRASIWPVYIRCKGIWKLNITHHRDQLINCVFTSVLINSDKGDIKKTDCLIIMNRINQITGSAVSKIPIISIGICTLISEG